MFGGDPSRRAAAAIAEVAARLPESVLLGCSTAGEIHDAQVQDASLSLAIAHFAGVSAAQGFAAHRARTTIRSRPAARWAARSPGPTCARCSSCPTALHVNGSRLDGRACNDVAARHASS